jgi:HK97 family phage prohead protease
MPDLDAIERLDAEAEFKFADNDAMQRGEFIGYASTSGNVDQGGDVVERGAFAETLKKRAPGDVALLFNHKSYDVPIGDWIEMRENDRGLVVKGRIDLDDPVGRRVHNAMSKGRLKGLSIGYRIAPGGAEISGRVRRLKALDLHEISVVTFPMNTRAQVGRVKTLDGLTIDEIKEIEDGLRDAGFSGQQRNRAVAVFKKWLQRDAGEPGTAPRDEADAAELAELLRRNIAILS